MSDGDEDDEKEMESGERGFLLSTREERLQIKFHFLSSRPDSISNAQNAFSDFKDFQSSATSL